MSGIIQINRDAPVLTDAAVRAFEDVACHLPAIGAQSTILRDRFAGCIPSEDGDRIVVGVTAKSAADAAGERANVTSYACRDFRNGSYVYAMGVAASTLNGSVTFVDERTTTLDDAARFAMSLITDGPTSFSVAVQRTPADQIQQIADQFLPAKADS